MNPVFVITNIELFEDANNISSTYNIAIIYYLLTYLSAIMDA